ncbi:family 20 glycosylhydrolase [Ligilactobacillus aviarius]|uniref:family 20 glycosylhydrolase n=1 Tax=Ligilactobacillus aviarius TaxID=1606 RepID=UPI0024B8E341|nr:family 20 glycosylhydrolase [Ligilactobacillus aviarius]MDM8278094.1 family 20 glycosylhydrolase [Ligilactobacillus aviarius]
MKKIKIIIVTIFSLLLVPISVYAKTNQQVMQEENQTNAAKISERNGILLDVARCPLTKYEIEQVIAQMNPQQFSYLILHLNDDEHVTFQSKILGNVGAPNTLSTEDLQAITANARKHHIILIPDFDTPGHCEALLRLLNQHNPKLARKIRMDNQTLDYTNSQTVKFVKEIDGELSQACSDQKYPYLMMGGDEVAGSGTHNESLMNYFNKLNAYENQKGFRSIIWNDSIMKHNNLSNKITVAYWAQGGANTASGLLRKYFSDRATVADLIHHPLINANEAHNYLNISDLSDPAFVADFIKQFNQDNPQNFNLINNQNWTNNPDSYQKEVATDGQLVCLWGGKNQGNNMEQLIQFIKELNTPLPSQSSQVSKVNSSSIESQSFSNSKIGSITG